MANYSQAELDELKDLIPAHLHKWVDYEPVPEPEDAVTPNEELNGVPYLRDVPGSHNRFPSSYFKTPEKPKAKKTRPAPLAALGDAPKATLNPKPGLNAKPAAPQVDLQKALLDLALSDEGA